MPSPHTPSPLIIVEPIRSSIVSQTGEEYSLPHSLFVFLIILVLGINDFCYSEGIQVGIGTGTGINALDFDDDLSFRVG